MYYEASDFIETGNCDTLKQIAGTRELTREYYFSDYADTKKREAIHKRIIRQQCFNCVKCTDIYIGTSGFTVGAFCVGF